jgi:endonuclease YncB( thermonuclease family)
VTHVRDGDMIEVSGVPVRIANLDCAELGTAAGNHANAVMRRWAATATASCLLEGRKSL